MKVKDTVLVPTSETTDEKEEKAQEENEDKKDEKTEEKAEKKEEKDTTEFLSVNWKLVKRESRMIDAFIKKNKGKNIERGHRDRNTRGGRYNEGHQGGGGLQRQVVSKEQQQMHDKAAEYRNRLVGNKSEAKTKNKIKLILNLLSPDNFEKKIRELRDIMFPENKTRAECFDEEIEFAKDKHLLTDENLDEEVLQFVVQNIFKKAQDEKLFCILNGQLCQRIIELEL